MHNASVLACVYVGEGCSFPAEGDWVSDSDGDKERFCAAAWPRLVAAVSHHCGDVHVAEELVQEALVRACRRWSHVSTMASPEGWAYRVAVNLATSAWRRQRAERRARQRHGPDPEQQAAVPVEDQLRVREELRQLTPQQRDAVILRYMLDLSVEQAAEIMQMSPGALRATTHRAAGRLRILLSDDDRSPQPQESPDVS